MTATTLTTSPPAAFTLGSVAPKRVERPETPEEAARLLAQASQAAEGVIPWGTGTKQRWGNAPRSYDVALDVSGLTGITEYEPADLVVTARAGMTLAALQQRLGESGQFLPLDPPYADQATLGGTLAANASGPSRLLFGTARDLVLGVCVATPDGTLVRSGGRVVKNVVGYDLNKLHIGGLGTAGVIVEVTFKVQPLAAAEATVVATFADLGAAHATAQRIVRSALYPRAVDLASLPNGSSANGSGSTGAGAWQVLVWCTGSSATVERQVRDVTAWCQETGASDVSRLDGEAHDAVWRTVREFGRVPAGDEPGHALVKLTCPPAQLAALLGRVSGSGAVARAGNGVAYVQLAADSAEVGSAARAAQDLGGSAVLEESPESVRRTLDVWDPAGTAASRRNDFDLMRAIKAQFDPRNTLNPGRFVAGI